MEQAEDPTINESGGETTAQPRFDNEVESSEHAKALGRAEPPVTEADMATVWHISVAANDVGNYKTPPREDWTPGPSPYVLQRMIARGGFGEVWEATQSVLRRRVAVKRIRADLIDTAGDDTSFRVHELAFRQEAMTTAALEHPNIPPVHDLGLDEDGHPLLAMKLVKGTPWDALISDEFGKLSVAEFLAKHLPILEGVAQAVAFAHARGIVHRDIKPAQVMVGDFGEVSLMDWGLAVLWEPALLLKEIPGAPKNIAPSLRKATSPAGTPAFMAPEQTERTAANIGPWTDVFLLGGTLYYLLTGFFPHSGKTSEQLLFQAALCEIRPPEARGGMGKREIPPDLSALAMQSLARDPKVRPTSVTEFIAAIRDYVTGASRRRESAAITDGVAKKLEEIEGGYKEWGDLLVALGKARDLWPGNPAQLDLRRRVFVVSAESALENGDLILARVQAERIPESPAKVDLLARIAAAEEEKKRKEAELEVVGQRLREHHAHAEELLNFMLTYLTGQLQTIGRVDILDAVVGRALEYFIALPTGDMSSDMLARRARGLRLGGEVRVDMGDLSAAESAFRESFSICADLAAQMPDNKEWKYELAESHAAVGRVLRAKGELENAGNSFRAAEELIEALLKAQPSDTRFKEALAHNCNALADVHAVGGDIQGAYAKNRRVRELASELVARDPSSATWQRLLAEGHGNHGWILKALGRTDEALDQYRIAVDIQQRIASSNPSNMRALGDVAFMHNKLGWVLESRGELPEAITEFRTSLDLMKQLVRRDPANMRWRRLLAVTHCRAAGTLEAGGELEDARAEYGDAITVIEPMTKSETDDVWNREWLSRALVGLGRVEERAGQPETARALWVRAAEVTRLNVRNFRTAELRHLSTHAQALLHLGRLDEARPMVLFLIEKEFRDEDFARLAKAKGFGDGDQ